MVNNPFFNFVKDFEEEAEKFLSHYGYKEAITIPQKVPIEEIVKRMSISVRTDQYLCGGGDVCGEIVFFNGTIKVREKDSFRKKELYVDKPTIFISTSISNVGRKRHTLAHECYHFWKHRNYFLYRNKYISPTEIGLNNHNNSLADSQFNKDVRSMEYQATHTAGKILMPRTATKIKSAEILQQLNEPIDSSISEDAYEELIVALSEFFGVSKQATSVRLSELYPEWGRTHYNRNYNLGESQTNAISYRVHPKITEEQAFVLYLKDDNFQKILDNGRFRFIDGYFVLNDKRYITEDNHLTKLATNNLEKCTIAFSYKTVLHPEQYKGDKLLRNNSSKKAVTYNPNTPQNVELQKQFELFEKAESINSDSYITGNQWIQKRMKALDWDKDDFMSLTLLNDMSFTRVNKPSYNFQVPTLVAIGVGLCLTVSEMEEVLQLYGHSFIVSDKTHRAYKFLFSGMYGKSILKCNEFLEKYDIEPLGSKQKL